MPYLVFGSETCSTSAPKDLKVSIAFLTASLTSSLIPSLTYSLGKAILSPLISLPISEVKSTSSTGALVESFASTPEIVSSTSALSLHYE